MCTDMKINSVKYFMKEASRNVFSNGWMSVASMFTVVASLLVFGIFMILALNVNHMVDKQEKDYEITLTVDENCTQEETMKISLRFTPSQAAFRAASSLWRLT